MSTCRTLSPSSPADSLCAELDRPREELRRGDLLEAVQSCGIRRITFHYTALDGRLKELKIPVTDRRQAELVLAEGERVDGSSLFSGLVPSGLSDLYVVPVYRSAFRNPFDPGSLDFVCRYLGRDGELAPFAPDSVLHRAKALLGSVSGWQLRALGELEFYVLGGRQPALYPAQRQRGYHAAAPYCSSATALEEMVGVLQQVTGAVKYGHAEVGVVDRLESESAQTRGRRAEQLEIEFLPRDVEEMADDLVLGRWLIRNLAWRRGCIATFVPKLEHDLAGNGLHFHLEILRGGRNAMRDADGQLSPEARRLIGGLCRHAQTLTAFGNTVASSYLRLVPNHEAPTRICWSDCNRGALIRVPLGWSEARDLACRVNPREPPAALDREGRQTVELRSPDGSALIHLTLAGMVMAAAWAGQRSEGAGEEAARLADRLYVRGEVNGEGQPRERLPRLPASCAQSAQQLLAERELYERQGVFPPSVIDWVAGMLREQEDEGLQQRLASLGEQERLRDTRRVMHRDLHAH